MTQRLVKQLFEYKDGALYWKIKAGYKIKIGKRAGTIGDRGYVRIAYKGKLYRASRLIFLYHYGYLPLIVDHKNRNKTDDRIDNLRVADHVKNSINCEKTKSKCSSKYKGVSYSKQYKKWQARISYNKNRMYLGRFSTEEEAAKVYNEYAVKYYGEFAYLNTI